MNFILSKGGALPILSHLRLFIVYVEKKGEKIWNKSKSICIDFEK